MAWVTKDSTETYNQTPEPPREYTKAEKAANWWHYHWVAVVIGVAAVFFGGWIIKDTVFQTRPDVQIAYVGTHELPVDTVNALQDALTPFCQDENGDGKVVVQVATYNVDFDAENESTDAYYQMAGVTRLSAELASGGKTYIFLLEDPEGFEKSTGVLQYLDGTVDDDPETADPDWREMVYRWTDCPVLTGLELGSYDGYTLMDDATGTNQSVLEHLYVGRRGVWDEKQAENYARRRMSRPLPPLKGHLRRKIEPPKSPKSKSPPLPDNPYRRFFTKQRSFEDLIEEKRRTKHT